jgi:transposase
MVSIDQRTLPVVGTIKIGTNNFADVASFIHWCFDNQVLYPGDYLILDNSRIHTSDEGFPELIQMLNKNEVEVKLLPKYSPELNPIEFIFAFVKHILRYWFVANVPLHEQIVAAFGLVKRSFVFSCYKHCLNPNSQSVST